MNWFRRCGLRVEASPDFCISLGLSPTFVLRMMIAYWRPRPTFVLRMMIPEASPDVCTSHDDCFLEASPVFCTSHDDCLYCMAVEIEDKKTTPKIQYISLTITCEQRKKIKAKTKCSVAVRQRDNMIVRMYTISGPIHKISEANDMALEYILESQEEPREPRIVVHLTRDGGGTQWEQRRWDENGWRGGVWDASTTAVLLAVPRGSFTPFMKLSMPTIAAPHASN